MLHHHLHLLLLAALLLPDARAGQMQLAEPGEHVPVSPGNETRAHGPKSPGHPVAVARLLIPHLVLHEKTHTIRMLALLINLDYVTQPCDIRHMNDNMITF